MVDSFIDKFIIFYWQIYYISQRNRQYFNNTKTVPLKFYLKWVHSSGFTGIEANIF